MIMGSMGQRPIRSNKVTEPRYEEPALFKDVATITEYAASQGFYQDSQIDLDKTIGMFSDVKIEYVPMSPTQSGRLRYIDGIWTISINRDHNKKRQRFTLAHELAHYILHKEKNSEFKDAVFFRDEVLDSMEYKANEFASELLMPEKLVRNTIDTQGIRNIGQLADKFGVSAAAMKYRILSLGYVLK